MYGNRFPVVPSSITFDILRDIVHPGISHADQESQDLVVIHRYTTNDRPDPMIRKEFPGGGHVVIMYGTSFGGILELNFLWESRDYPVLELAELIKRCGGTIGEPHKVQG